MRNLFLACLLIPWTGLTAWSQSIGGPPTVLVIYSNDRSLPANRQIDDAMREELIKSSLNFRYLAEFLDYPRYGDEFDERYDKLLSDFLRAKYRQQPIDTVVAVGPQAFRFLYRHQTDLFADIPVLVIATSQSSLEGHTLPVRFLTIPIVIDPLPTLKMAVRLQPKATEIVVVTGTSQFDLRWAETIRRAVARWESHPPVRYLSGLPLSETLSELSHLRNTSIVYSPGIQRDGRGEVYINRDVVHRMTQVSSAPVYSSYSTMINFGIVGGYMFEMPDLGRQGALVLRRLVAGEKLTQGDMPNGSPSHYVVDWNQMQHWQLAEANLPSGTIVVNRDPNAWQKYKPYFIVAVLGLLLQSALIFYLLAEKRRKRLAQRQLAEQLRFETLVAQVSSEFANLEPGHMDQAILNSVQKVQEVFPASITSVWQSDNPEKDFVRTHVWPEAASGRPNVILRSAYPATFRRLSDGEHVAFSSADEMNNMEDSESFRQENIRSFLAIPLHIENRLIGALSFVNITEETEWPAEILPRLRTIGDILGGALARQHAAEALRESELLKDVILQSIQSNVAVIDNDGTIIEANQPWTDSGEKCGAWSMSSVGVGANYFEVCQRASNLEAAAEASFGIQSVLSGLRPTFELEYASHSSSDPRWFRMTVMPLPRLEGGALIIHFDITNQKLADLTQQRMQEEMAQLHRVTEMGQLVASLAHELAQPLAAVLTNAQAASRMLAFQNPDLPELQNTLTDIIEDDQRAAAVLNGVRDILKKHPVTPHSVNLNEIVESVTAMVRNNAQLRGVQLRSMVSPSAVLVRGDEVPLQQVLLNLVNNAMDAMSLVPPERRVLTVKTEVHGTNSAGLLVVEDQGPGIPEHLRNKLFQPFVTSKGEGLGMGLAICNAILQTLGGSIELQDRSEPGATFHVKLPLAA